MAAVVGIAYDLVTRQSPKSSKIGTPNALPLMSQSAMSIAEIAEPWMRRAGETARSFCQMCSMRKGFS